MITKKEADEMQRKIVADMQAAAEPAPGIVKIAVGPCGGPVEPAPDQSAARSRVAVGSDAVSTAASSQEGVGRSGCEAADPVDALCARLRAAFEAHADACAYDDDEPRVDCETAECCYVADRALRTLQQERDALKNERMIARANLFRMRDERDKLAERCVELESCYRVWMERKKGWEQRAEKAEAALAAASAAGEKLLSAINLLHDAVKGDDSIISGASDAAHVINDAISAWIQVSARAALEPKP